MLIGILVNLVRRLDNSAIKFANQFVRRFSNIYILWKWLSCVFVKINEYIVRFSQLIKVDTVC